ncbi:hypothetical protein H0E85_05085 [Lactiplantibacillus plantarum]|uniref:hypothetical protein n=1 Tax=Lactiplantibacillus plantarum TaxID=1590 RepID=UPI0015ECD6F7|nr:hypothetical protein [Lactiplantibacillus plantarum]QLQ50969.1 hypothetical protein H0E85_05085 [Lactiplantibacillus plantarum]
MTKAEALKNAIEQINNQNTMYWAILGVIITLIGIFLAGNYFQQKRISDKQVEKFQKAIEAANEKNAALQSKYEMLNDSIHSQIKSLSKYSMTQTIRNDMIGGVRLKDRISFYIETQQLVQDKYASDMDMKKKLKEMYVSVVRGFKFELLKMTRSMDGNSRQEFENAFQLDNYAVQVDFNKLKQIGENSIDNQQVWGVTVQKLKEFIENNEL